METEHVVRFASQKHPFLIEDHNCANRGCDRRQVHLVFRERVHQLYSKRCITIRPRLMATFTLAGKLSETRLCQESASTTMYLPRALLRRCSGHFRECRRHYGACSGRWGA
jgi:hypothetical protein